MCGISGLFGPRLDDARLHTMMRAQEHRGPDSSGEYYDPDSPAALGHNRLSIIDRTDSGRQPMSNHDGSLWVALNGEIYNYLELRAELASYPYRSRSDTEVILAAYERWGDACVDHFIGMFSFLLWDRRRRRLFAARDRFGVKPLYYHLRSGGELMVASEIAGLLAGGAAASPDASTWATYLTYGLHDHSQATFWRGIQSLPAGHALEWRDGATNVRCWYDLPSRVGPDYDDRPDDVVQQEYLALLVDSVRLRFRSDVPVGISLSGGLDSSTLLGLVDAANRDASQVLAFTYITGDPNYDELPWVKQMLARTRHPLVVCPLTVQEIPDLARSVQAHQSEPFGGFPTLAYARLHEQARSRGTITILDGNGMDEQWAGYDYYMEPDARNGNGPVQGSTSRSVRPDCLHDDFRRLAKPVEIPQPFPDRLRNRQYWDLRFSKIPRALRFNDRVSMRASTELREPFLDHRCVELAFRQPRDRKIRGVTRKWMVRQIAEQLMPSSLARAPKRPVQTPQREWLKGPLRSWASECIEECLSSSGGAWFDAAAVRREWADYCASEIDNSFYVWQWISMGLTSWKPAQVAA